MASKLNHISGTKGRDWRKVLRKPAMLKAKHWTIRCVRQRADYAADMFPARISEDDLMVYHLLELASRFGILLLSSILTACFSRQGRMDAFVRTGYTGLHFVLPSLSFYALALSQCELGFTGIYVLAANRDMACPAMTSNLAYLFAAVHIVAMLSQWLCLPWILTNSIYRHVQDCYGLGVHKLMKGRRYWKILDDLCIAISTLFATALGEAGMTYCMFATEGSYAILTRISQAYSFLSGNLMVHYKSAMALNMLCLCSGNLFTDFLIDFFSQFLAQDLELASMISRATILSLSLAHMLLVTSMALLENRVALVVNTRLLSAPADGWTVRLSRMVQGFASFYSMQLHRAGSSGQLVFDARLVPLKHRKILLHGVTSTVHYILYRSTTLRLTEVQYHQEEWNWGQTQDGSKSPRTPKGSKMNYSSWQNPKSPRNPKSKGKGRGKKQQLADQSSSHFHAGGKGQVQDKGKGKGGGKAVATSAPPPSTSIPPEPPWTPSLQMSSVAPLPPPTVPPPMTEGEKAYKEIVAALKKSPQEMDPEVQAIVQRTSLKEGQQASVSLYSAVDDLSAARETLDIAKLARHNLHIKWKTFLSEAVQRWQKHTADFQQEERDLTDQIEAARLALSQAVKRFEESKTELGEQIVDVEAEAAMQESMPVERDAVGSTLQNSLMTMTTQLQELQASADALVVAETSNKRQRLSDTGEQPGMPSPSAPAMQAFAPRTQSFQAPDKQ
eukprot:s356_g9.t1